MYQSCIMRATRKPHALLIHSTNQSIKGQVALSVLMLSDEFRSHKHGQGAEQKQEAILWPVVDPGDADGTDAAEATKEDSSNQSDLRADHRDPIADKRDKPAEPWKDAELQQETEGEQEVAQEPQAASAAALRRLRCGDDFRGRRLLLHELHEALILLD